MPAFAQLVGNTDTFSGIEKAHGRFTLSRATLSFTLFAIITIPQSNNEKTGKNVQNHFPLFPIL